MTLHFSRRHLLGGGAALLTLPLWPRLAAAAQNLVVAPAKADVSGQGRMTDVFAYDAQVPGPLLRIAQGERLQVTARNQLEENSTIHWHGIRLPVAMDGVPGISQPEIPPGGSFTYDFPCPDAGTFWYHPHVNSGEQLGRGLYGALIVEEPTPLAFDRDELWVLSDWRLDEGAQVANDFGDSFDAMHDGRVGNFVNLNGKPPGAWPVTAGQVVRLRLLNAAAARIFALGFEGHEPMVIALDGQPCTPHQPKDGVLWLGPGQRADLALFTLTQPGSRHAVIDYRNDKNPTPLLELVYDDQMPLTLRTPVLPVLPPNPLPVPDLTNPERLSLVLTGGMQHGAGMDMGGMMEGAFWALNGESALGHTMKPLWSLVLGKT